MTHDKGLPSYREIGVLDDIGIGIGRLKVYQPFLINQKCIGLTQGKCNLDLMASIPKIII